METFNLTFCQSALYWSVLRNSTVLSLSGLLFNPFYTICEYSILRYIYLKYTTIVHFLVTKSVALMKPRRPRESEYPLAAWIWSASDRGTNRSSGPRVLGSLEPNGPPPAGLLPAGASAVKGSSLRAADGEGEVGRMGTWAVESQWT